ncbi:MAG: outer membrane protein transport protein [Verrucomicrobia bacterium]|nr:outer membrane protein transport protein [Verrucomicrobiota bacterium]
MTAPKRTEYIVSWLLLPAVMAPASALALGIRIPDQDPAATARGNAFTATADDPAAIYYNPAGITQLSGSQVQVGTYAVWLDSRYTAGGAAFDTTDRIQAVPQIYYTYSPPSIPLSFGLGFYSPYGLSLQWPDNTPFRTVGTQGELTYLTLNPVVAWRVNSQLSIAAGPTLNYSEADLRKGLFLPGDQFRFKGDDTAAGYNVGLRWQPLAQWAFGATYRSETTLDYRGTSQAIPYAPPGNASARFAFPQDVTVGLSFRPTPNWNLEFDVDWTDWSRLQTVTINQAVPAAIPFNWRSSFMYEWGVTRSFANGYSLSAGYMFSQNSVPAQDFTPLVPDSDRHIFSAGIGRKYRHLGWEAAYQFAYGPPRTVVSPGNPAANGTYRFLSHALTVSLGYSF